MFKNIFIHIPAFLLLLMPHHSHALDYGLSVVAVGTIASPTLSTILHTNASNAKVEWGGGLLGDLTISGPWSIEAGVLYITRNALNSTDPNLTTHNIQIPLLVRYSLLPFLWLGAGPYWNMGTETAAGSNVNPSLNNADYGAIASLGLRITSIVGELRYAYRLNKLTVPTGQTLDDRDLSIALGLRF